MKGLRKYLSPFTPDQSGAVSVLLGYGGLLIILDAGGCVGNICGFDEPRWADGRSAVFSAGLRDLDAILGRDELLIRKTRDALEQIDAAYVGLIGTPVPAVIGTDYRGLRRLMEQRYGLPVVPVETNGMALYDVGQEKAYLALLEAFAAPPASAGSSGEPMATEEPGATGAIGVLGATPLDMVYKDSAELCAALRAQGYTDIRCYGDGDSSIEDLRHAGSVQRNLVVSPSGLAAARWLQARYGTPYEIGYPIPRARITALGERLRGCDARRVLVIHQQVFANAIRRIVQAYTEAETIQVATWFQLEDACARPGDAALAEEDELLALVERGGYDTVIGDPLLLRALPGWQGRYLDLPHYAVSAGLHAAASAEDYWRHAAQRRQ